MQIEHKLLIEGEKTVIYLDVYLEDNYEFSKENFNDKIKGKNVRTEIKKYIEKNVDYIKGAVIVVAINGILIGALTMNPQKEIQNLVGEINNETKQEIVLDTAKNSEEKDNENKDLDETTNDEEVKVKENLTSTPSSSSTKKQNTTTNNKTSTSKTNATTNKTQTTTKPSTTTKPATTSTTNPTQTNTSNTNNNQTSTKIEETKPQGTYIKLNTNGVVKEIELETYIIGVVAAEMPASFNIEALKAQAVAARTYAMKKASQGITLKNSTSDQVYKTTDQMKSMWGSSFSTYYNKVKNAVNATKGLVLKYNGAYIDAQYSSMTNGKTELPENVWTYSRPYLQCVSSTWDTKVANFQVTKTFTYEKVSSSLGQTVTPDTNIEIISRTVSDRVDKIQIGDKTFAGTKLRSLLGLRSTDFSIKQNPNNIEITTKGYGHGVGMSQYGAHMAANEGYTYRQILNHYYVGAQIVQI